MLSHTKSVECGVGWNRKQLKTAKKKQNTQIWNEQKQQNYPLHQNDRATVHGESHTSFAEEITLFFCNKNENLTCVPHTNKTAMNRE